MRSSGSTILIAAVVAAVVSYGVVRGAMPKTDSASTTMKETTFERIRRTGVIRCGYIVFAPYLLKDPNNGQMSGVAYEIMQAVAKELSVKIEWTEETGWGTFHEGLNGNRFDLMCVPVWETGDRTHAALLTKPVYYNAMYAFARADDNRFDQNPESVNRSDVTVAYDDNGPSQAVHDTRFPLTHSIPPPAIVGFNPGADECRDTQSRYPFGQLR